MKTSTYFEVDVYGELTSIGSHPNFDSANAAASSSSVWIIEPVNAALLKTELAKADGKSDREIIAYTESNQLVSLGEHDDIDTAYQLLCPKGYITPKTTDGETQEAVFVVSVLTMEMLNQWRECLNKTA